MSSEKPVSDPLEPEGTGVPADAAAEHATSGNDENDTVTSSDETDIGTAESADPDATVKSDKAVAEKSTVRTTKSTTATDSEATGPDDDATVRIDKAAAGVGTEKVDSDATVVLNESDTAADASTGATDTEKKADDAIEKISTAGKKSGTDESADSEKPAGRRSPFPLPALIGAAVLLVAALVAVGVFFFLAGNKQEELDRRAAATEAACDFGNNFATYTGDKADDYLQRLDQSSTGKWKDLVSQIGPDLKTRFAESKVSSTATGVQCGYESGSGDQARVVLVIDQQFTTANVPQDQGPGQVKVAANVSMQKVDGTWLVADFDTPMMQQ
ncbi:hypothetical protein [Nocardia jinanensis]|uniref:Mce-associated membrane protein n=1 Tax=Nocardia jinanensis TaxID=382504 RepID=A0A917RSD9_9NOCA|nr:hypothetical protein [Nocardia jinanensis]GGL26534.1 hypothetical protein GCM10011588_46690 [Nocardia jinanensis]